MLALGDEVLVVEERLAERSAGAVPGPQSQKLLAHEPVLAPVDAGFEHPVIERENGVEDPAPPLVMREEQVR